MAKLSGKRSAFVKQHFEHRVIKLLVGVIDKVPASTCLIQSISRIQRPPVPSSALTVIFQRERVCDIILHRSPPVSRFRNSEVGSDAADPVCWANQAA